MERIFCSIQASTNGCVDTHLHGRKQKDLNPVAVKYRSRQINEPIGAPTHIKLTPFYHSKSTINAPETPLSMLSMDMESTPPWHRQKDSSLRRLFKVHHKWAWKSAINAINRYWGSHLHGMKEKYPNPGAVKYCSPPQTNEPIDAPIHTKLMPLCHSKSTINRPGTPLSMLSMGMEVQTSMAWSGKIQTLVQLNIAPLVKLKTK